MNRSSRSAASVLICVSLQACSGSAETDLGPIEYSRVQKIFDQRCAGAACHIATTDPLIKAGDLDLSATQAAPCMLNVPSSEDPQRLRIKPGDPSASYLMCKIDPACSSILGSPMPIGDPLSAEDIAVLRAWISQGAQGGATGTCATAPTGSDTMPPTFAGATLATSAPNSVRVQWSAATDNVTPSDQLTYLLYQATAAGAQSFATPSYTSAPGVTSYSVGRLAVNTRYYFVVRSRDQAGNSDGNNVEVSATTPATSDTQAPNFAGLTTASASGTSVTLNFPAASDNVTAANQIVYLIYQATAAGAQTFAAPTYTSAPGVTTYTVTGLGANTTYYFVVRAQDGAGNIDTNTVERNARTATISFSGQVQPIFNAECGGGACHAGMNPAQGLNLGSAAASYAGLVNAASSQCPAVKRVLPSQPDMSYLMWKLQGSGPCFSGSRMPKGAPLPAANLTTIRSWIAAGAPNN